MKIGELAQLCGVTPGTIRYYVSNGMLVPDDSSAQYNFTEREYRDLQLILKMKQQQFNLREIQHYLSLIRHSNLIEPDTIDACLGMLSHKKQEISEQICQLQQSMQEIDQEIADLTHRVRSAAHHTGVPLHALRLLVCPHCGRPLRVEDAVIQDDFVDSGTLCCPSAGGCPQGYRAQIEHGIVKTGNLYTAPYDRPDLKRKLYRDMGLELSIGLQKCYDYTSEQLRSCDLHGKVILEANINGYFFLYHHLSLLPEDCICVIVDKFPEMLEMYKSLIEQLNLPVSILYIADASMQYPLKPASVDLHISYLGENEHQLYHKNSYLADAKRYFKADVQIFGVFWSYDKGAVSRKNLRRKYPESSERCFQVDYLKEDYNAENYRIDLTEVGSALDSGTRQFSFGCHEKGEPLRIYRFVAALYPPEKTGRR